MLDEIPKYNLYYFLIQIIILLYIYTKTKVEVACIFFLSALFLQVLKYVLHCILYILNYRVQGTSSGLLQNFKRGGSMAALFEFSNEDMLIEKLARNMPGRPIKVFVNLP